jgi:nucleoside-diphosphate-sugar epimerase
MDSIPSELAGAHVLVTGAGGFIGRHLCRSLTRTGAHVTGLLRSISSLTPDRTLSGVSQWVEADIRDMSRLRAIIRANPAITHVFHLAAATSGERSFHSAQEMIQINTQGTINLLSALEGSACACFIHTGSAEEYGPGTPPFRETHPMLPVSPYSASKAAATLFCQMYHRTLACPVVILRPFLVYGPGQASDRLIPQVIHAALNHRSFPMTTGQQTREFTYIDDLIDGYLRAATTPEAIGQIINLGTGHSITVLDAVRTIKRMTRSRMELAIGAIPTRPGEIMRYECDNTRARDLLKWSPKISLHEGLSRTIAWYREHPEKAPHS